MFVKGDPRIYRGGRRKYSQEMIDFIRQNAKTMSDRELSEAINERFNLYTSRLIIKDLRRNYGINKYREPYPVLTESTNQGKYVKIKNAVGKWVYKHTFLWEQAKGKIPEGYNLIFLDGNKKNIDLDNLALVANAECGMLSALGLRFNDPGLTQMGIAIVKHKNKIKERKNIESKN